MYHKFDVTGNLLFAQYFFFRESKHSIEVFFSAAFFSPTAHLTPAARRLQEPLTGWLGGASALLGFRRRHLCLESRRPPYLFREELPGAHCSYDLVLA
jgi:hypothetical protein